MRFVPQIATVHPGKMQQVALACTEAVPEPAAANAPDPGPDPEKLSKG
jgi:hypothetical protein